MCKYLKHSDREESTYSNKYFVEFELEAKYIDEIDPRTWIVKLHVKKTTQFENAYI